MKRDIVLMDCENFEKMLVESFNWDHGISMVDYCEEYISFYWDFRTESEIRNSQSDMEISWDEIAEQIGYDNCELCLDENENDCVLCWND